MSQVATITTVTDFNTVTDIIRHYGSTQPDHVAIHFNGTRLTYGDLDRRTNRVANGMIALDARPQARIAVLTKNDPAFFELWLGAAKANAVLVPVNCRLAAPEITFVVNDAMAELLFVGREFYPLVESIAGELGTVRKIVALDGLHDAWPSYSSWLVQLPVSDPALPTSASDCAIQMYTSGTTAYPKGAQLSHANLLTAVRNMRQQLGNWHAADVNLVCMPLFHIGGFAWALASLYGGISTVLMRDFDPPVVLRTIAEFGVTKALFVPAMILALSQAPRCRKTDFSSLELIAYGGSPVPLELVRNALTVFGCGFAQVYGLTETSGPLTCLPPEQHHDEHANERLKSVGRPMPGVDIRIVDDLGQDVPAGAAGEVICRTPQIMLGYWNLPEATEHAIRGGWFFTGDVGYMDDDGYIYIYDRIEEVIISGAENIYPAEVESALFGHPALNDVAVIGVPDERWGEKVKAVVVRKPGSDVSEQDLIAFARQRIAGYKAPRSVDFVDALPRNPAGKILKRELRNPYWITQDRQVH